MDIGSLIPVIMMFWWLFIVDVIITSQPGETTAMLLHSCKLLTLFTAIKMPPKSLYFAIRLVGLSVSCMFPNTKSAKRKPLPAADNKSDSALTTKQTTLALTGCLWIFWLIRTALYNYVIVYIVTFYFHVIKVVLPAATTQQSRTIYPLIKCETLTVYSVNYTIEAILQIIWIMAFYTLRGRHYMCAI